MGYSDLIVGSILTNNCSVPRNHEIDTITPHYMVWYTTGDVCAESFVPSSRQASANYCIGKNGDIWLNVDEDNRAWTSGNYYNDHRAVTIECANYMEDSDDHVYGQLPDATWNALVELCADICRRNGKNRLVYNGDADYSNISDTDMLLTMHKWFQSTDCPGPWLSYQFDRLAAETNALLNGEATPIVPSQEEKSNEPEIVEEKSLPNMMISCVIDCKDEHSGYPAGAQILWTAESGFEYINHPDSIKILDAISNYYTGHNLYRVSSSSSAPWIERLAQVTASPKDKTKGLIK